MEFLEILEIGYKQEFPTKWDELEPQQFIGIIKLLTELNKKTINLQEFKIYILLLLLNINPQKFFSKTTLKENEIIKASENLYYLTEKLDFLFEQANNKITFDPAFHLIMIQVIKRRWKRLYGPNHLLANLTFEEYHQADLCFNEYHTTNEEKHLDRLVAILYRPRLPFYKIIDLLVPGIDSRVKFKKRKLKKWCRTTSMLPFGIKYAIFWNFSAIGKYIRTKPININGKEIQLSKLFKQGETSESENLGLTGLLYSLSESGVFGDIDKTAKQNIYDVFLKMYQNLLQYEVFKKNADSKLNK